MLARWGYRTWVIPYRVKKRVFPCLRYPFTFENYTDTEFRKNTICADLRQHGDIMNPLKRVFRSGEPFSLVICVANDNSGITLKNVRLRMEFDHAIEIQPGQDWGAEGHNSYIFRFCADTITNAFAINASQLTLRVSTSGLLKVKYTIGADEIDGLISGLFFLHLGTHEELFPYQPASTVYYTINVTPVASASSAYKPSNDWMIRESRDAKDRASKSSVHEPPTS